MLRPAPIPAPARPYAVAVFALAQQRDAVAEWGETLRAVADAASAVFAEVAGRALVPQPKLGEAVAELAGEALRTPEARNFVAVLADNRRLELAGAVAELFEQFRRERDGVERVLVETALPVDDDAKAALEAALRQRLGKDIRADYRDNPALLAGARVFIRDNVLDASARGRLERLAEAMRQ